jgi:hypothetical protein
MATTEGQLTLTTAGTAYRITTTATRVNFLEVKASPDNAGNVYVKRASSVSASNSYILGPGDGMRLEGDLSEYYFTADNNNDKVTYQYE